MNPTTRTPPRQPRPIKPTHEDRAAGLVTRAEYITSARRADLWRVAAVVMCLYAAGSAGHWQYVQAAQIAAQTNLIRPLSRDQAAWLRQAHQRQAPPRVADLAGWRSPDWWPQYPGKWWACQQRPTCAANLAAWTATLAQTPELRQEQHRTQGATAAAALALLAALLSAYDLREWRSRERDALDEPARRRANA